MSKQVLCIGEVLWDSLPEGLFLGGAPHNVARHLHQLGAEAALVSRVGDDVLGREALRRIGAGGMPTELVQVDDELPTGFVKVELDDEGVPEYEIVEPVAWDAIALDDVLHEWKSAADAVVFGSLAQRREPSRVTVQAVAATDTFTAFDVNLRPPHVSVPAIRTSLEAADLVKLNEDELAQLLQWFDLPNTATGAIEALARRFGCRVVCVTRGREGAVLWHDGRWTEHPGFEVQVRDTVGAGDAFLAVLLDGLLAGEDDDATVARANRLGAYVATQLGATPDLELEQIGVRNT